MKVDKTTTVDIRFYGRGELENGVAYEAIPPGAMPPAQRVELCDRTIPKGLKGPVKLSIGRENARIPALEQEVEVVYVKDPDALITLYYHDHDLERDTIEKAKKLYNANVDAVILVSLSQGTSESYKSTQSWVKEKPAEETAEKKPGRKKAAKKKARIFTAKD